MTKRYRNVKSRVSYEIFLGEGGCEGICLYDADTEEEAIRLYVVDTGDES